MGMNAKAMAAMRMKDKEKQGMLPKNPLLPNNIPNLVPPSPIAAASDPLAAATASIKMPKFVKLKKKLGGF